MTDPNLTPAEPADQPDHFAEIAAELRRAADGIETLVGSGLRKPGHFQLNIQPGTTGDDEATKASVDAMAWALAGETAGLRLMASGSYFYSAQCVRGPISFSIYQSVSTEWALRRDAAAKLAEREAELERLRAEVAELRAAAKPDDGMSYTRADTDADDPTPVSPARMALHTGGVVDGGQLVDETPGEPVTWHFSFGHGQTDPDTGENLLGKYVTVVAPTYEACRSTMFSSRYGNKWSFDYDPASPQWLKWGPTWTEHERIHATAVEHYETTGWTGGDSGSGVACACGVTYDGFDSLAEAAKCLKRHIEVANAAPPLVSDETIAEAAAMEVHYRFGMRDTACGLKPGEVPAATADHAKVTCKACIDGLPF